MTDQITYEQAGVNTGAGAQAIDAIKDAVHSTYRPEVIGDIGAFGGLFDISAAKDLEEPVLVSGTDGVGTKLKVAQFLGKHDTVGIDLVAMCVNDVLTCGAEPLFFLDYVAVGKLEVSAMSEIVGGVAEGCKQAGCALIGGEMAEHPGVMDPSDYDLSGCCVALVDRHRMLGPDNVSNGDVLLGLASSGIHSNGYALARKVTIDAMTHDEAMTPRDDLGGMSVAEALLVPTRIYVNAARTVINTVPGALHALAHITGGGITENLNRAMPDNLNAKVKLGSWNTPPIIDHVVNAAHLAQDEALKTFNMGIGMVFVVAPECVDEVERVLHNAGETTYRIGSVTPGSGVVEYC